MIIWGTSSKAFPALEISKMWEVGSVRISPIQLIIIGLALTIMVFLYILVFKTKAGTAMRATSLDSDASRLMGINVEKIRLLAFVISCALASAAGSLVGEYYHSVVFNMGYGVVLKAFVVAILGGMGNIVGAMIGGLLMGFIECFGAAYISSSWKDALVYIVLIFVLFVKPNGLLGTYEQEKV
jgi:branched-chain amino acid transport system permease protein